MDGRGAACGLSARQPPVGQHCAIPGAPLPGASRVAAARAAADRERDARRRYRDKPPERPWGPRTPPGLHARNAAGPGRVDIARCPPNLPVPPGSPSGSSVAATPPVRLAMIASAFDLYSPPSRTSAVMAAIKQTRGPCSRSLSSRGISSRRSSSSIGALQGRCFPDPGPGSVGRHGVRAGNLPACTARQRRSKAGRGPGRASRVAPDPRVDF